MKSGTYFVGDVEDSLENIEGSVLVSDQRVKNVLEIKFVEKVEEDPTTKRKEMVLAPKLFPIGYPMNMKAMDLSLEEMIAESWFEVDSVLPLTFVKIYMDTVQSYNSPIIQPKPGGIVF